MSFKEKLLDKIKVDKLAEKVRRSIGPSGGNQKIDKAAVKSLMEKSPYKFRKIRDLELFVKEGADGNDKILVLDNELPLYKTTVADVAMRKSPTVKEMLSIRNAIKILNDKDVVLSKRLESVETIHQECVDMINLDFNESDIAGIEKDGIASLENAYTEGVVEALELFAELLQYSPPPKEFKLTHYFIRGALSKAKADALMFGPIVIYDKIHNTLKLIDDVTGSYDKGKLEVFKQIAAGKAPASLEGEKVFEFLRQSVIDRSSR